MALEKDLTQSGADELVAQLRASCVTPVASPVPGGPVAEGTEGAAYAPGPSAGAAPLRERAPPAVAVPEPLVAADEDGVSGDVCVERAVAPKWWTAVRWPAVGGAAGTGSSWLARSEQPAARRLAPAACLTPRVAAPPPRLT